MTRYFLDSNILINALNNKTSASGVLLTSLLQDKNSQIFVSPLVLYEVLRGVNWENEGSLLKLNYFFLIFRISILIN